MFPSGKNKAARQRQLQLTEAEQRHTRAMLMASGNAMSTVIMPFLDFEDVKDPNVTHRSLKAAVGKVSIGLGDRIFRLPPHGSGRKLVFPQYTDRCVRISVTDGATKYGLSFTEDVFVNGSSQMRQVHYDEHTYADDGSLVDAYVLRTNDSGGYTVEIDGISARQPVVETITQKAIIESEVLSAFMNIALDLGGNPIQLIDTGRYSRV